jgi:valyl-tRNA synthetase
MRRLGTSPDWSRERFTMDAGLSKIVTETFVRLYNEGLIYRGKRLVNWDPKLGTAVSDLEVVQEEEDGSCGTSAIRWPTAAASLDRRHHPPGNHARRRRRDGASGRRALRPPDRQDGEAAADRPRDPDHRRRYVDLEFGTGCVKVTPAHDFNDYAGRPAPRPADEHPDARREASTNTRPEKYRGLDRFEARKAIVADLEAAGPAGEDRQAAQADGAARRPHRRGDRADADRPVVRRHEQAGRRTASRITEKALDVSIPARSSSYPENWVNTYNQWLNNIQDWCISRQLWWGHQIPAWYGEDGERFRRAQSEGRSQTPAVRESTGYTGALKRDEDVLDTWYSSPCGRSRRWTGPRRGAGNPTRCAALPAVVGAGHRLRHHLLLGRAHGHDDQAHHRQDPVQARLCARPDPRCEGQKMSKSKGNVLDPIDLIDGIGSALVEEAHHRPDEPRSRPKHRQEATRKEFPDGIPPSAPTRCASPSPAWPARAATSSST